SNFVSSFVQATKQIKRTKQGRCFFIKYNLSIITRKCIYKNILPSYRNYDGCILAYASGIPELRRLHNSRMVYTKHPVWYIPYDSFAIYQSEIILYTKTGY
ncbi:MAG: hypothetical protein LBV64_02540, partial [Mediterranea sp.]|nr:hypothetical protein [Mediterranea sp.]